VPGSCPSFIVAFQIPTGCGAVAEAPSQGVCADLAEYKSARAVTPPALVNQVATALTLVLVVVALLGIVGAPWVAYVSAPGFRAEPEKFALTVTLLRITFPYIIFISLVALAAGILNTFSKFSVPAFAPVLLNLSMIAATLWLAPYFDPPVLALGWGVALGGVLQLAWMLPHLLKIRMLPRPTRRFDDPGLKRVLKLMAPATLGVSVAQISLLINTVFASFLATGSVSWLYYADRLMEFPTACWGGHWAPFCCPAWPSITPTTRRPNIPNCSTGFAAHPAACAALCRRAGGAGGAAHHHAVSLRRLQCERREHDAAGADRLQSGTGRTDPGQGTGAGFYARQNIRTPVKVAIFTLVATQLMNLAFIGPLGHAGLALAIGLGACLNAGLLLHLLKKQQVYQPQPGWTGYFLRVLAAVALMAAMLFDAMGEAQWWLAAGSLDRLVRLSLLVGGGIALYFAALGLMGFRPRQFARRAAN